MLTDIFAVGKFDYSVMVRYQNLTRKPKLFRAPIGSGAMYPLCDMSIPYTRASELAV